MGERFKPPKGYIMRRLTWHVVISILAIIAGIGLILVGYYIAGENAKTIWYSIGGGLLVVGVVELSMTFIYKKRWEYGFAEEMADKWGVLDIQSGRGRAEEDEYREVLRECENKLHIQAISLTRFRNDLTQLFEEKAAVGIEIRLLLMDPDSELCEWYEQVEPERSDLSNQIRNSVQYYQSVRAENLEIRYYDGLPNNYFRVDQKAFIGPYFVNIPGRRTITLLTDIDKRLGSQYKENFEKLWEHSREPGESE